MNISLNLYKYKVFFSISRYILAGNIHWILYVIYHIKILPLHKRIRLDKDTSTISVLSYKVIEPWTFPT